MKTYEAFIKNKLDIICNKKQSYLTVRYNHNLTEVDNTDFGKIKNKIRKYDIVNKFKCEFTYLYKITPDAGFVELIKQLNIHIENKIPLDVEFEVTIVNLQNQFNLIEFKNGIHPELRGLGVGYKIYKIIINTLGYITSDYGASDDAKKIWYNLMLDPDLYCYTSKRESGAILKTYTEIKEFLDKIRDRDLIFDDELKVKIKQLYGSMKKYKKPT